MDSQPQSGNNLRGNDHQESSVFSDLSNATLDTNIPVAQQGVPSAQYLVQTSDTDIGPTHRLRTTLLRIGIGLLILLTLAGGAVIFLDRNVINTQSSEFSATHLSLDSLPQATQLTTDTAQTLTVNGQLQVSNSVILNPSNRPTNPLTGQIYYDQTSNQLAFYNGTQFLNLAPGSAASSTQNTNNVTNVFNSTSTGTLTMNNGTPGTANVIPKFSGNNTLSGSILTDNTNFLQIAGGINLIAPTTISNLTFWDPSVVPGHPNFIDIGGAVELGVKFTTDVPGVVNGVRFYRGTSSSGPYVGSLWTSTGSLLAQATFAISGFGWQEVKFAAPVTVSPDTTYVVSYHTSGGGYATDSGFFGAGGVDNGPVHALASGLDGGNGVYNYSPTPIFPNKTSNSSNYWADVDFSGATLTSDSRIRVNGTQLSSSDLGNDSNIAKRGSSQVFSGHNIFRNANDSADTFDIQKTDTTAMFTVDTLDSRIYIGPNGGDNIGTLLVLGSKNNSVIDPPGIDGAMYYNLSLESFRCYHSGMWSECGTLTPTHGFSLYDEFMGGATTSLAANSSIGNLGWSPQAIGANGSISFNPSTPAPIADRPGVLALQTPAATNQGTTLMLGNTSGGSMIIESGNIMRTAVAVGAATNQVLRVGLDTETTATTQPISGVWWEANPSVNPNWRYCYGDGTTATCAATTVAIAANTWERMEVDVTATGTATSAASFSINGNNVAKLTNVTIDTTNRVSPAYSCYALTNAAQNCYWDYFQLIGTTSVAR